MAPVRQVLQSVPEWCIFRDLEQNEAFFIEHVGSFLALAPGELEPILSCQVAVDKDRLSYAWAEYVQGVRRFSMYLQSGDPDHYKRAGALAHALYLSQPIVSVDFDPALDDADTLCTGLGVTYGDAEGALGFGHFFGEYHNEFIAFALAYDTCRQYEEEPTAIDFPYVHTVCTYLGSGPIDLRGAI